MERRPCDRSGSSDNSLTDNSPTNASPFSDLDETLASYTARLSLNPQSDTSFNELRVRAPRIPSPRVTYWRDNCYDGIVDPAPAGSPGYDVRNGSENSSIAPYLNRCQNGLDIRGRGGGSVSNLIPNGLASSSQSSRLSVGFYNRLPQRWFGRVDFDSLSVRNWRGKILSLSMDLNGCRILANAIESARDESEIDMVLVEIIEYFGELMVHQFGNYVVQSLVEMCNKNQLNWIVSKITETEHRLVNICLNTYGTRAVQRLLRNLESPGQEVTMVMSVINPHTIALAKDINGHHVIQHCLRYFTDEDNRYVLFELARNYFGLAMDKSGCCVLQQCVDSSSGVIRDILVTQLISNALPFAEDPYGNYVVQHLLDLRRPHITAKLLRQLQGSFASLSFDKYGSNVVEKCFFVSTKEQCTTIILELLSDRNVSMLLIDPFGNFVVQSALRAAKGPALVGLLNLVQKNYRLMRSNIYGKKVLEFLKNKDFATIIACMDSRVEVTNSPR